MPRRRNQAARRTLELTWPRLFALTCGVGADDRDVFQTDRERRAVWLEHRDRILENHANHGRRPWGWWHYESSRADLAGTTEQVVEMPDSADGWAAWHAEHDAREAERVAYLRGHDLLSADELTYLADLEARRRAVDVERAALVKRA